MKNKAISKEEHEFQDACKIIIEKAKGDIVAMSKWGRYSIHEMNHILDSFELISKAEYQLHED